MTVLHVAAWRREPQAIANLLEKGAHLKDLTLYNQTALDISKRLTKKLNPDTQAETQKERLCISLLEQADRRHTVTVPKSAAAMLAEPSTEQELMSVLLYLENRGNLGLHILIWAGLTRFKYLGLHILSVNSVHRHHESSLTWA